MRDPQWRAAGIVSPTPTGRGAPRSPARGNSSARPLPPRPLTNEPAADLDHTLCAVCRQGHWQVVAILRPLAPALAPQQEQLASGHFFTGKERGAEWFRCCISGGSSFAPKASRKDGTHSFKDACGHVATQIGFSMGPVADVKVVRHEDRLSIRYANRANGLRAGRLLNAAQWSDGNPRPWQRDSAVDCQGIDMRRRR